MHLRMKIILLLTVVFGGLLAGNLAVQRQVVQPSFAALERREAIKDWERCRDAMNRECEHLLSMCSDWAFWDDSYRYLRGEGPDFFDENLSNEQWFTDQKIDALLFVQPDGKVLWSRIADHDTGQFVKMQWLPSDRFPADHPIMRLEGNIDSNVNGLMLTELGPMMIAARPILTSQFEGPMAGIVVFGRTLCKDTLAGINAQTQVDFTALPLESSQIPQDERQLAESSIQAGVPQISEQSDDRLQVVGVLNDLSGKPMLMIKSDLARTITAQGKQSLTYATISLSMVALATLSALVLLLRWLVIRPLSQLSKHVSSVGVSGELHQRLNSARKDEIGQLANEFDRMIASLDTARKEAMDLSRQAGMAEVATGVLHNVGNVLNSVNVSVTMVGQKLRDSKLPALGRAAGMLQEHEPDLAQYITSDAKGKRLPAFFSELAKQLSAEQSEMTGELDQLRRSVDHIKEIVGAQQRFAKVAKADELLSLPEIVEDAIRMNVMSLERHHVEIVRDFRECPPIRGDRHKVVQILVNLLSNAKKAVTAGSGERRITIEIEQTQSSEGSVARLCVRDSGVGILPENLSRIFNHGFTTGSGGHGFGLHSAAIAAQQMNGSLKASSDGLGKGAAFTLELPLQTQEACA